MKKHRALSGLFMCFTFFGVVAIAQDGNDAPKVSDQPSQRDQVELNRMRQCGDIWQRVRLFVDYLEKNDDLDGIIIVDNTPNLTVSSEVRRRIAAAIKHRKFDLRRVTFVTREPHGMPMVELIAVVGGNITDRKPVIDKEPVIDTSPADTSEPFAWSDELEEKRFPGCQKNRFDLAGFASYLKANPAYRGKVEIDERTTAAFNRKKLKMLATLARQGIAKNRMTYILNRVDSSIMDDEMTSTLWIIPKALLVRNPQRLTVIGKMDYEPDLPTEPKIESPLEVPPPITTTRAPRTLSGGILNARAIKLPVPKYPPAARAVKATGAVSVEVLIDEKGNVISASAVDGHPLLRAASTEAARAAKFTPVLLSGTPVRMAGQIIYNFVP